jgi:uncharacterized protein (TIGR02597 family)
MKYKYLFAPFAIIISLSTFTPAFAQVTTDPVGYITLEAAAGDDSVLFTPLERPFVTVGSPSSISNGTLTIGSDFTVNELANRYYALFTSGTLIGEWFEVTSNTANTLTVADDLESLGALTSDTVKVIPFWTLAALFPSGEGFVGSTDVFSPLAFVYLNNASLVGTNLSLGVAYFYHSGEQIDEGWYANGDYETIRNDTPLSPETFFTIRNSSNDDISFVLAGGVPVNAYATNVGRMQGLPQDNKLVNPFPLPITLSESELFESGAVAGSTDVFSPVDFVLIYDNEVSTGTNVSPPSVYFYHTGLQIDEGWYANGDYSSTVNDTEIPAGGSFIVRKASGDAVQVKWSPPNPYISNSLN